ncbi:hypothetical protein [Nocardia cyriacigeorgica]|uniref:hypothetical protein n=1 Tax=Nocardia cyriacigeorgica TaxID=135487 RepID=UPI0024576539|nr:hypothetical protein [Nocardia cyriacigeorgica]
MHRTIAAVAVTAAVLVPAQLASPSLAVAEAQPVSTGSAEIPPSCVGKVDPIVFFLQSLAGTQPRHCL